MNHPVKSAREIFFETAMMQAPEIRDAYRPVIEQWKAKLVTIINGAKGTQQQLAVLFHEQAGDMFAAIPVHGPTEFVRGKHDEVVLHLQSAHEMLVNIATDESESAAA